MNNKGQTLVIFVILLPVILICMCFIVDVGLMYNAKIKGNNLLKEASKENYNIDDYFELNDINIESIEYSRNNINSCAIIKYRIDSVFGVLIKKDNYLIRIDNC